MRELDTCLDLVRKIKEKNEIIYEKQCRMTSPKNQIITDMPKGGGSSASAMDDYLISVDKIIDARDNLQAQLDRTWDNAIRKLKRHGVTRADVIKLLWLRFYNGLQWEKCSIKMKEAYPNGNWNINKCFRVYRSILHKTYRKN